MSGKKSSGVGGWVGVIIFLIVVVGFAVLVLNQ